MTSREGSTKLEKTSQIIYWKRLGTKLNLIIRCGMMGRPPYPSLSLFKVLALQRLYGLSDPQIEEMLYDRLSFRRFCDFGLTAKLPDKTTICKFRGALGKKVNTLLGIVLEDLADQGLTIKGGAIVDSTVIFSKPSRPKGDEVSTTNPEPAWTQKAGTYHQGYKMHTCVDEEPDLVQGLEVTSADLHDSIVFGQF